MGCGGIVGAIVGAATFGLGSAFFGTTLISSAFTGAALGMQYDSYQAAKKAQQDMENARRDSLRLNSSNSKTEDLPIPIIYGTCRFGGNITYDSAAGVDNPKDMNWCIAVCEGEIQAIREVKINDDYVTNYPGCSYNTYTGTATQQADSRNTDEPYKHTAHISLSIHASETLTGTPTITAIIDGLKVNVWKDGNCTKIFTRNPAWCLYDMMTNRRYGIGINPNRIDLQSFIDAAAYCDELVSDMDGGTEPRYLMDATINTSTTAEDIIAQMASNFRAFVVQTGGKYSVRCEKPEMPVQTFTEGIDIIEGSMKVYKTSKFDIPNRLVLRYIDPVHWVDDGYPVDDDDDIRYRGLFPKTMDSFGITRRSHAARICEYMFDMLHMCRWFAEFNVPIDGVECQAGDIINLTHSMGKFVNQPFRILTVKIGKDDTLAITARMYNALVYSDDPRRWDPGTNIVITDPLMNPPDVGDLVAYEDGYMNKDGVHISNIYMEFTEPNYLYKLHYDIWYKYDDGDWAYAGPTTTGSFTIGNVLTGKSIQVKVVHVNTIGRKSTGVLSGIITIVGKDTPPPNVDYLTIIQIGNTLRISVPEIKIPDFNRYELRLGSSWNNSTFFMKFIETQATADAPFEGTASFLIKAVDNSGNYSKDAKQTVINIVNLPTKNILFTQLVNPVECVLDGMHVDQYDGSICTNIAEKLGDFTKFIDFFDKHTLVQNPSILLPEYDVSPDIVPTSMHETKLLVNTTYNELPTNNISTLFRTKFDPDDQYGEFNIIAYRNFYGRFIQTKLLPTSTLRDDIHISAIEVIIDVDDIEDTIQNVDIPAEKTRILFKKNFLTTPKSIALFTCDVTGKQIPWRMTGIDRYGFDLELMDGDTIVAGKLIKAIIGGF